MQASDLVSLHAPAPSRVAENIDVRGEESEPRIVAVLTGLLCAVILHPRFVSHHAEHLLHRLVVESGGQRDRHRIDRGITVARNPVQRLVPPAVGWNAQPLNGRVLMLHHPQFLFQSQLVQKQLRPLVNREARIAEILLRHRTKGDDHGYDTDEYFLHIHCFSQTVSFFFCKDAPWHGSTITGQSTSW